MAVQMAQRQILLFGTMANLITVVMAKIMRTLPHPELEFVALGMTYLHLEEMAIIRQEAT